MAAGDVGVFMAFGTLGDVLPVTVRVCFLHLLHGFVQYVAAALARSTQIYSLSFITHSAHQSLRSFLSHYGIEFRCISTPPVVPAKELGLVQPSLLLSEIHMEECLREFECAFQESYGQNSFIAFNLFGLEGWHISELYNVKHFILAPYVMPYSAPASFEQSFKRLHPLLYKRLQQASAEEISWNDVTHWMWPLFTDRWTSWRVNKLHLSACPLTDPVTELPVHNWPSAVPLLYGFSEEVVECPSYWPRCVHVCGFWFPPADWKPAAEQLPPKLSCFLSQSGASKPLFVGLSSIYSMGFLHNPDGMLQVLLQVLKLTEQRGILFTAGYPPLEGAISKAAGSTVEKDGFLLNARLFCYSGYVPYKKLFPECSVVLHHGGSGTTAACLQAGVPQIICPFILDQFYWAERMSWLGVAPHPLKSFHLIPEADQSTQQAVEALSTALIEALSEEMRTAATQLARRIHLEDGCSKAVQEIIAGVATKRI